MTPEQLAAEQRTFLIRTEKQAAILLRAEFERLKQEISNYLLANFSAEVRISAEKFVEEILSELSPKIDLLPPRLAAIVERSQGRVIRFAAGSLRRYLPAVETSIFSPDRQAIQKLIGRAYDGQTLQKFFARMKPGLVERIRAELIEGFAAGESSQQIARRMATVSDAKYTDALVVSRNETVNAYRSASLDFFEQAEIKEYVWLAVLDPRTCLRCWLLHGRRFKTKVKVFIHVNCRCCIAPVTKNQSPSRTGAELFLKLEAGVQKQILGPKRFEIFQTGEVKLNDFMASRRDLRHGEMFFVKNLSDL